MNVSASALTAGLDWLLYAVLAATVYCIVLKCLSLRRLASGPALRAWKGSEDDLDEFVEGLEGGLTFLAVVASGAPFVGLAGTVIHIMAALSNIKGAALDIAVISGPVAASLQATLLGLASAIPAAAAYSLLSRRIQVVENTLHRKLRATSREEGRA